MRTSESGIELIKKYEGCKLEAYRCPAGVLTIGYGSTKDVSEGDCITQDEAERRLESDIKYKAEVFVDNFVSVKLNQNQYDALVSFTFNLGGGNLQKSTLLKKLNSGDYNGAAKEFTRWVYANGKKLNGLVKRRKDEKKLFLKEV